MFQEGFNAYQWVSGGFKWVWGFRLMPGGLREVSGSTKTVFNTSFRMFSGVSKEFQEDSRNFIKKFRGPWKFSERFSGISVGSESKKEALVVFQMDWRQGFNEFEGTTAGSLLQVPGISRYFSAFQEVPWNFSTV